MLYSAYMSKKMYTFKLDKESNYEFKNDKIHLSIDNEYWFNAPVRIAHEIYDMTIVGEGIVDVELCFMKIEKCRAKLIHTGIHAEQDGNQWLIPHFNAISPLLLWNIPYSNLVICVSGDINEVQYIQKEIILRSFEPFDKILHYSTKVAVEYKSGTCNFIIK